MPLNRKVKLSPSIEDKLISLTVSEGIAAVLASDKNDTYPHSVPFQRYILKYASLAIIFWSE